MAQSDRTGCGKCPVFMQLLMNLHIKKNMAEAAYRRLYNVQNLWAKKVDENQAKPG